MLKSKTLWGLFCTFVMMNSQLWSGVIPINKNDEGIALKGYDAVAYFIERRPVEGMAEFSHEWNGAIWYFSNAVNQTLFAENPEKYAPQFGGYCSWAVSNGYTADVDPGAWKIVSGSLYLNYNAEVLKKWEDDALGNIKKANENWTNLLIKADPVNKNKEGVALRGYDAVAYFIEDNAVEGNINFQHEWSGAIWYFNSAANQDKFKKSPEKYAPQFGGHCSWAVGSGYTADADPRAWKIVDGKLYLNWSKDVQKGWLENVFVNIKKGEKNWPQLVKQK